jgi:D-aspartate ligase
MQNLIPVVIFGDHIAAYGVIRALGPLRIPIYIVSETGKGLSTKSRYVKKSLALSPFDPYCIKQLNSWVSSEVGSECVMMVAGDDDYLDVLAKNYKNLPEGAKPTFPDWQIVKLVREKRRTYKIAEELGIPTPTTYYITSEEELKTIIESGIDIKPPFLMKSEHSKAFNKTFKTKGIICDKKSGLLKTYRKYNGFGGKLLLQEMIPGEENNLLNFIITLNCNSDPTAIFINRKRRSSKQFLSCTLMETCRSDAYITENMLLLLKKISYYGYANPELKFDQRDKKYKLIEINGRVSVSNSHALRCGINLPYLMYQEAIKGPLKKICINNLFYKKDILWWHPVGDLSAVLNLLKSKKFFLSNFLKSLCGKGYIVEPFNLIDPMPMLFILFKTIIYPFSKTKSLFTIKNKI